jgi:hypothetical protein
MSLEVSHSLALAFVASIWVIIALGLVCAAALCVIAWQVAIFVREAYVMLSMDKPTIIGWFTEWWYNKTAPLRKGDEDDKYAGII